MSQVAYRTYVCFNHKLGGFTLRDDEEDITVKMVFWKAVPNNVIYRSTGTYTIPSGQLNFRIDNSEKIFLMSLESDRDYRHITDEEFTIPIEYDDSYSLLSRVEFGGVWLKAAIEIHAVNT